MHCNLFTILKSPKQSAVVQPPVKVPKGPTLFDFASKQTLKQTMPSGHKSTSPENDTQLTARIANGNHDQVTPIAQKSTLALKGPSIHDYAVKKQRSRLFREKSFITLKKLMLSSRTIVA